jgi:putative aldouronate transport system substrate-binding protein
MKKMGLLILLAVLVGLPAFAGGGQAKSSPAPQASTGPLDLTAPYTTPVTVEIGRSVVESQKYPAGDGPESNDFTRFVKKTLNIDIKTLWAVPDYDQRVNLAIASNSIPDSLVVNFSQLNQLVKNGMIQPLTQFKDLFIISDTAIFNGELMAIPNTKPSIDSFDIVWIRKDWMDSYGLAAPKTLEDLKNVARTFVRNGHIGIVGPSQGQSLYSSVGGMNFGGLEPIFDAYNAYPGFWIEQGGKAVYGSTTSETRAALADLRSMYAEGLIDKEIGVRKDASELAISGQAGIFGGAWWTGYSPIPDCLANNPEANWQPYVLPSSKDGKYYHTMTAQSDQFLVVRKGYAYPEAVMKVMTAYGPGIQAVDTLPDDEYPLRLLYSKNDPGLGGKGVDETVKVKGMLDYLAGTTTIENFAYLFPLDGNAENDFGSLKEAKLEPYTNYDIRYWNTKSPNFPRAYSLIMGVGKAISVPYIPVHSITYANTQTMERRWANLKKIEDETFLKIIMGIEPITAFDTFVAQWKREGGDQILAEITELIK